MSNLNAATAPCQATTAHEVKRVHSPPEMTPRPALLDSRRSGWGLFMRKKRRSLAGQGRGACTLGHFRGAIA